MMKKARAQDGRLDRVAKICKALPKAICEIAGKHAVFQVSGKTFAYYLHDHHGDGIIGIACKVLPGDNEALVSAQPAKFFMPSYVGPRGWVGLRLDVAGVDWGEVAELLTGSYRLVAPKKLAAMVQARG